MSRTRSRLSDAGRLRSDPAGRRMRPLGPAEDHFHLRRRHPYGVGHGYRGVPPLPLRASYEAAESAFGAGRYTDAVELFTAYNTTHPENPWGQYMLGMSAWKTGEHEKALNAFDQALQLDPNHRKSLFNSARVLLDSGRPKEALERIEKALALEPMSNEALRLLGRARYELGDVDGVDRGLPPRPHD